MAKFIYMNNLINDRDLLLYYINRLGRGKVSPDFDIERNDLYPYCVIHYVVKGHGHVIYRGKDYDIKSGDIFILNAYENHHYFTDKDDLLELEWIEFAGADAIKLINAVLKNGEPIIRMPYSKKIDMYLKRIFLLIKEDNKDNEFLISKIIYSMLLNLLHMNKSTSNNDFSHSNIANISKVIYFIDNNLSENIDIEMLSKICNYSPTYFSKLFLKVIGTTPMNYVLEKRIGKAKEFLSKSNMPVEQLSEILGFSSASHFTRCFKKLEGLTPSEYRNQSIMLSKML